MFFRSEAVAADVAATLSKLKDAGVCMTNSNSENGNSAANKFIKDVVSNLEMRFSDDVSSLCSLHEVLQQRTSAPDFIKIAKVLGTSSQELQKEWEFIQRLDGDLSSDKQMITIATSPQYIRMYPTFSAAIRRLLLLPVATATVERSFSTLNHILSDKRCRLTPDHTRHLMLMSVEGPRVPDARAGTTTEQNDMDELLSAAYSCWLTKPRRGLDTVHPSA